MTSPSGCSWTASSSAGWISITAGGSGSGNGSISYTVAANTTINSRSGTITVAGQTLAITQTGIDCTYSLSSGSASFDSDEGGGVVGMTSPTGCTWTTSSSAGWITITAGGSGSGNGSVSYTVAANTTINSRTGTITASGQTLTISQTGIDCTYSLSSGSAFSTRHDVAHWMYLDGLGSAGWITITAGGSGSGNGSVSYTVAAVAGQTLRSLKPERLSDEGGGVVSGQPQQRRLDHGPGAAEVATVASPIR